MMTRREFEDLNLQLIEARKAIRERDRILDLMAKIDEELKQKQVEQEILAKRRQFEQMDVEELEGTTVASLFFRALGRHEAVLEQQVQEYLEIKLAYDACQRRLTNLHKNLASLEEQLVDLADVDDAHERLRQERKQRLVNLNTPEAQLLERNISALAENRVILQEVNEALEHGRQAQNAINAVQKQLNGLSQSSTHAYLLRTGTKRLIADSLTAQAALEDFDKELQDIEQTFWQDRDPQSHELADSPFSFMTLAARMLDTWDNSQRIKLWHYHMLQLQEHVAHLLAELNGRQAQLQTEIHHLEQNQSALIQQMWQPENFAD